MLLCRKLVAHLREIEQLSQDWLVMFVFFVIIFYLACLVGHYFPISGETQTTIIINITRKNNKVSRSHEMRTILMIRPNHMFSILICVAGLILVWPHTSPLTSFTTFAVAELLAKSNDSIESFIFNIPYFYTFISDTGLQKPK